MKTFNHARHSCRRTALAHGLLLALSLGLGSAAAMTSAEPFAVQPRLRLPSGDDAPRDTDVDALLGDWRATHRERPAPPLPQGSHAVTNCGDGGPGSLRDAISAAASGDTIDLTATGCSAIRQAG